MSEVKHTAGFTAEFDEPQLGFGVDCYMVDYDGCLIQLIGATPDLTRRIVHCANNLDRVVEALRDLLDSSEQVDDWTIKGMAQEKARNLLTELEQQRGELNK